MVGHSGKGRTEEVEEVEEVESGNGTNENRTKGWFKRGDGRREAWGHDRIPLEFRRKELRKELWFIRKSWETTTWRWTFRYHGICINHEYEWFVINTFSGVPSMFKLFYLETLDVSLTNTLSLLPIGLSLQGIWSQVTISELSRSRFHTYFLLTSFNTGI